MDEQPALQYDVEYPDHLSRILLFLKWLLVFPHFLVLGILGVALEITTFVAWWAILFTGRYPRGLFDFAVMVLRWGARVNAYYWLLRDEYPPFGDSPYPVEFALAYPERLSRWKIFVKWILLIPHFIALTVVLTVMYLVSVIAWFAILITGNYPRGLFDFTVGATRWLYRVTVYSWLLTDAYPPFSTAPAPLPPAGYAPARPI